MTKTSIAFLHTSPAAIAPLMQYYSQAAPELEITNLLEDGLLRFLSQQRYSDAESRLRDMLRVARETYQARLAMITCSSVPLAMAETLQSEAGIPVLKIDGPMARRAVEAGRRIGIAVTFEPTIGPTSKLLDETAARLGKQIELIPNIAQGAYQALLNGDPAAHDHLLLGSLEALEGCGAEVIVLAQVSMARVLRQAKDRVKVPVFSSVDTSLDAVREALHQA